MTYRELLKESAALKDEGRLLLMALMDWDLTAFLDRADREASPSDVIRFREAVKQREAHVPLQHITGKAPFYGRDFMVNGSVLIPRFDTEILVYEALKEIRKRQDQAEGEAEVLDLCTGSGCIAVTLRLEGAAGRITASDLSPEALETARKNAELLGASDIDFVLSDMFSGISGQFDLIVSNPPYIPDDVIRTLDPEVKDHDPYMALSGGEDGLAFYRIIAAETGRHLKKGGRLFLEIGHDQGKAVSELLDKHHFTDIRVIQDLNGKDRVITCSTDLKIF
ncbi:MAG: peptide chain release factor N(5)-glutamine methyltransferase [Lachnospiraceae bacterium]|nr:peptide chain release factor N(5)-glutamine methyltransferase [Lachnospiraceae bacterium]